MEQLSSVRNELSQVLRPELLRRRLQFASDKEREQIKKELRNELGDMIDRLSSALSGCALGSQQNTLILQQAKHKVEQLDNIAEVDELSSLLNNLSL